MPAAQVNLEVGFGESWDFDAIFPNSLDFTSAVVEIEVLKTKDILPERALLSLSTVDASITVTVGVSTTTISFFATDKTLQRALEAGNYHWRMYIKWLSGIRDEIMSGKFIYKEKY